MKHEIGMSLFRNGLAAVQDIGGLLIKRGTAMGPLVPLLLLVPVFIGAAWLFKSVAVVAGAVLQRLVRVAAAGDRFLLPSSIRVICETRSRPAAIREIQIRDATDANDRCQGFGASDAR